MPGTDLAYAAPSCPMSCHSGTLYHVRETSNVDVGWVMERGAVEEYQCWSKTRPTGQNSASI
eukprot:2587045-Rhodomonas_salina.1